MTKRQEAIARKAAWQLALLEGRVVRWQGGMQLTSYPTVDAARAAIVAAGDETAEIVRWEPST